MRSLLLITGAFVAILCMEKPAKPKTIRGVRTTVACMTAGVQIAGLQRFNNVWTLSAELAGSASEIICMSLRQDRIPQKKSERGLHLERRWPSYGFRNSSGNLAHSPQSGAHCRFAPTRQT
jgi:hypothetical protein